MKPLVFLVFLVLWGCSSEDPVAPSGDLTIVQLAPEDDISVDQTPNTPVVDPTTDQSGSSGEQDQVPENPETEPDTTEPETTEPETTEPETTEPETTEPETTEPETTEPETTEPETTEPETTEPDTNEPDTTEPETTEPETTEPETTEPETTEPETTEPETTEPETTEPETTEPESEDDVSTPTPINDLQPEGGGSSASSTWLLSSEQGFASYSEASVPTASDSVLRPSAFSFPSNVWLSDTEPSSGRVELAFSTSVELSELLISSDQSVGHWVLALTPRSETPFPDVSQNTQAIYYDIDVEINQGEELCLWFQAIDRENLVSDKFQTCFAQPSVTDTPEERTIRYFDRQQINDQPSSTLHQLAIDSLELGTELLGLQPRQSLVIVGGRYFAVDANRFFEIDPVTGEDTGTVNQRLLAYTTTGSVNEFAYLLDHLGNVFKYNTETGEPLELLARLPWKVLSYGNLVYRQSDNLFYSTVRFKDPDNDFLFTLDPESGDYEVVGVTGARNICQLTISREQLFALSCDGSLSLIDPDSGETAPLHETEATRSNWLPSVPKATYTGAELQFPARGVDWRYWSGSDYHRITFHSGRFFDDSHAYDLSKDGDVENLIAVTPIAPGDVVSSLDRIGFVLIRHDGALVLDDGSVHPEWYSGYMHLSEHSMPINQVTTDYVLGYLSDEGTSNNHLHFAIYIPQASSNGEMLVSIDIGTQLRDFVLPIHEWINGCNWPIQTNYFDFRWWADGDLPCPDLGSS